MQLIERGLEIIAPLLVQINRITLFQPARKIQRTLTSRQIQHEYWVSSDDSFEVCLFGRAIALALTPIYVTKYTYNN